MPRSIERLALSLAFCVALLSPITALGGGVTLITHGLNGDVDGWVTGMADQLALYPRLVSTNVTCYKVYLYPSGSTYALTWMRASGPAPSASDTGEIIIKLDWSVVADGDSWNTYQVAALVAPALSSTTFLSELGGHALAEYPMHLIGHSRGGSLICELSRILGTNGIWIDHISTLDPHPLNNDGFTDFGIYSAVDAPAKTYANVLFHDNTWQNLNFFVHGEAVSGAYVRKLTSLSGGYSGASAEHSNVHLWYHGTIQWSTPASDTEANITSTQRTSWWAPYEQQGTNAGFLYSLIGGGNRLSTDRPLGGTNPAIKDGYNQVWDLGAGISNNRTALTTNTGAWASLLKVNRATSNAVVQGQSTTLNIYYQWARPATSNATLSIYLDNDLNPLNANQTLVAQTNVPGTTATGVNLLNLPVTLSPGNSMPGWHALYAVLSTGSTRRLLYAPELVRVVAPQPLSLDLTVGPPPAVGVNGTAGQTVVLQTSSDLVQWESIATNTLSSNRWLYADPSADPKLRFYRGLLGP